jgi:hypothetical protein
MQSLWSVTDHVMWLIQKGKPLKILNIYVSMLIEIFKLLQFLRFHLVPKPNLITKNFYATM